MRVVPVLSYILLDWRVWHKASQGVWETLLRHLEQLLVLPSNGIVSKTSVNWCSFMESSAITKILLISKVCLAIATLRKVPAEITRMCNFSSVGAITGESSSFASLHCLHVCPTCNMSVGGAAYHRASQGSL